MNNPLLQPLGLMRYAEVKPEHVAPAIDTLLTECNAALEQVISPEVPLDYDAMDEVLSVATERLGRAWGAVGHLHQVCNTPEIRSAYGEALPKVTEFYTRMGSDERLYAKYQALAASPSAGLLSPARLHALGHWLRDFKLGGADLQGQAKRRFAAIQDRMAELQQNFSNHVLDATDAYAYYASADELDGVPNDVVAAARAAAVAEGKDGHKVSLQFPSYFPVLQTCRHRPLRETLYRAYVTRASELGDPAHDNSALMTEILRLRQEEAQLLGYATFADVSLATKMARHPAEVLAFLRDLGAKAKPAAMKDLAELQEFAANQLGLSDLQAWDVAFAAEKLKEARYAFNDQEVKAYLPLPKVLAGLFGIIEQLFDVRIAAAEAPTWHESVRFYRIHRGDTVVGEFYLDPYARAGKSPGAWMDGDRSRWLRPDSHQLQTPIAHLVCNFAAPVGDKPALLRHDDVITLFHEFGHGLHHLLTQVNDLGISGISGVEWDAVELPSQFMENFCWEWDVLSSLSAHVDTGEPLPRALFDKMLAAKNFQSGLQLIRQVDFALFDMRLHTEADAATRILAVAQEVREEVAVLMPPAFARTPHTFSHIFAGGYSAGYYSYLWAEVLSADAWSAFEEAGVMDAATGQRYRREVLEVGGSRAAIDSFKAFRGREPSIDALLRHQGIAA